MRSADGNHRGVQAGVAGHFEADGVVGIDDHPAAHGGEGVAVNKHRLWFGAVEGVDTPVALPQVTGDRPGTHIGRVGTHDRHEEKSLFLTDDHFYRAEVADVVPRGGRILDRDRDAVHAVRKAVVGRPLENAVVGETLHFRRRIGAPADLIRAVEGAGVGRALRKAALMVQPAQVAGQSKKAEQRRQHDGGHHDKDAFAPARRDNVPSSGMIRKGHSPPGKHPRPPFISFSFDVGHALPPYESMTDKHFSPARHQDDVV